MTILVKFELLPQNDKYEEIKTFFSQILPDTRQYTGNEGVVFAVGDQKSKTLMLVEFWRSQGDFIEYLNWRVKKGDVEKVEAMLIGEMGFKLFNILDDCYLL